MTDVIILGIAVKLKGTCTYHNTCRPGFHQSLQSDHSNRFDSSENWKLYAVKKKQGIKIPVAKCPSPSLQSLQVTVYKSRFTTHGLQVTVYKSRFTSHGLQVTVYKSRFTSHGLQVTVYKSQFTGHSSQFR